MQIRPHTSDKANNKYDNQPLKNKMKANLNKQVNNKQINILNTSKCNNNPQQIIK